MAVLRSAGQRACRHILLQGTLQVLVGKSVLEWSRCSYVLVISLLPQGPPSAAHSSRDPGHLSSPCHSSNSHLCAFPCLMPWPHGDACLPLTGHAIIPQPGEEQGLHHRVWKTSGPGWSRSLGRWKRAPGEGGGGGAGRGGHLLLPRHGQGVGG